MLRIRAIAFVCFVFALSAFGCGGPPPSAKLTGKITYKGQLVKGGTIMLKYESTQATTGIGPDGTYMFNDMPLGHASVLIETESYNPTAEKPVYAKAVSGEAATRAKMANQQAEAMGKGKGNEKAAETTTGLGGPNAAELAKLYTKIPVKYTNEKTSGLSITVEKGAMTKDFELTD